MDADIAGLVRAERLHEAGMLARARGDAKLASELFERGCAWNEAAEDAMRIGDPERALLLAVQGRNEALAEHALTFVQTDRTRCARVAANLDRRGDPGWAARLYEAGGHTKEAARAWEQAGDPVRAAALLERTEDVLGAARLLETQLRRAPDDDRTRLALGGLLVRFAKTEAAVRILQKIAPSSPERVHALALLVPALASLGLQQAEIEAQHELEALGGSVAAPASARNPNSVRPEPLAARHLSARLFGRYEVVREIASSPMARVVECNDPVRSELVAVKIFAGGESRGGGRDALARFEREVRVLAAIEHPNVVPLRDYIADGPALVLAWMSGGTLETRLAAEPLSPSRAVEIAGALLAALGEAHRLGVVHRDVKPANVLFDDAGVARLADFGVAHLGDLTVTATAGIIGTLAYMSPEQREGRPATVQSDLYGVGAILLEMLTAERLTIGEETRLLPSATHRDLDARHDAVVLRLLAQDPAARPADAFTARRELTQIPWPDAIEPAAHPMRARAESERPHATRLEAHGEAAGFDRWIERDVQRIQLSERTLGYARAFALADHPTLQTILRVDREANELWLEPTNGTSALREGSLSPRQARDLGGALDALHAQGAVHGAVDSEHVRVDANGRITLTFHEAPAVGITVDHDRLAYARLSGAYR